MKFSIVKKMALFFYISEKTFAHEPAKVELRERHFEIPTLCRRHYSWSISLDIVSENSADGRELLHGKKRETLYGPQVSTVIRLFLIAVIFKKEKKKKKEKRVPRSSCSPENNIKGSRERESRNDSRIQYPLEKIRKIFIPTPCCQPGKENGRLFFFFYCQQRSLLRDSGSSCFIPSLLISFFFLSFYAAFNIIKTLQINPTKKREQ